MHEVDDPFAMSGSPAWMVNLSAAGHVTPGAPKRSGLLRAGDVLPSQGKLASP